MRSIYNGKALEYCICLKLCVKYNIIHPTDLINYGEKYYTQITDKQKQDYISVGEIVIRYFSQKKSELPINLTINSDDQGKKSLVGDIIVWYKDNSCINLSIKNNKLSAKHQRPAAFMDRCGLPTQGIKSYRSKITQIKNKFYDKNSEFENFRDIKIPSVISDLYSDINNVVTQEIQKFDKKCIQQLYKFLVGIDLELYIVRNTPTYVEIYDLTKQQLPTRVKTSIDRRGYIILHFNNNCNFSMRLHSAESKIRKNVSLKYDTIFTNIRDMFLYEKIPK